MDILTCPFVFKKFFVVIVVFDPRQNYEAYLVVCHPLSDTLSFILLASQPPRQQNVSVNTLLKCYN